MDRARILVGRPLLVDRVQAQMEQQLVEQQLQTLGVHLVEQQQQEQQVDHLVQ